VVKKDGTHKVFGKGLDIEKKAWKAMYLRKVYRALPGLSRPAIYKPARIDRDRDHHGFRGRAHRADAISYPLSRQSIQSYGRPGPKYRRPVYWDYPFAFLTRYPYLYNTRHSGLKNLSDNPKFTSRSAGE